jgi:hypothetical protein
MASAGIKFAYVKATESTYLPDSQFAANTDRTTGAIGHGIAVGVYHFATPLFSPQYYQPGYDHQNTAEEEAQNFYDTAKNFIGPVFSLPCRMWRNKLSRMKAPTKVGTIKQLLGWTSCQAKAMIADLIHPNHFPIDQP